MSFKKVLLLIFIGVAFSIIILGGIFYFQLRDNIPSNNIQATYQYEIKEVYADILDTNHILKSSITIEVRNKKLLEELNKNRARIINDILELFRNKKIDELSGKSGQQTVRNEILNIVKGIVSSQDITNVYFTEFIIQ